MRHRWIILPYDESVVATLTLRRAARLAHLASHEPGGILLAVGGTDPSALEPILARAEALVSPEVRLNVQLISAAEPVASLLRCVEELPNAALAAPLGGECVTPWFAQAVRGVIGCRACPVYAFYVDECMVREALGETHGRPHLDWLVGVIRRGGARVRLGVQSIMRNGVS